MAGSGAARRAARAGKDTSANLCFGGAGRCRLGRQGRTHLGVDVGEGYAVRRPHRRGHEDVEEVLQAARASVARGPTWQAAPNQPRHTGPTRHLRLAPGPTWAAPRGIGTTWRRSERRGQPRRAARAERTNSSARRGREGLLARARWVDLAADGLGLDVVERAQQR